MDTELVQRLMMNYLLIADGGSSTEFHSRIIMPNSQSSSEKAFNVQRSAAGINSITSSVLTLSAAHNFENSESVRVLSDNGRLPDGLESNRVYYVITDTNPSSGLSTNDIKLANSSSEAEQELVSASLLVVSSRLQVEYLIKSLVMLVTQFSMIMLWVSGILRYLQHQPITRFIHPLLLVLEQQHLAEYRQELMSRENLTLEVRKIQLIV